LTGPAKIKDAGVTIGQSSLMRDDDIIRRIEHVDVLSQMQ
jgi:hypothetical protein